MVDPEFAVIRNLNDAGCDAQTKATFLELHSGGRTEEEVHLLQRHRKFLLAEIHKNQKKIDCLDVLLFRLQQQLKISTDITIQK